MAHSIMENDNIAWWGETPWHKLGLALPEPVTSDKMLILSGLDWPVEKHSVEAVLPSGISVPCEDQFATVKMAGKGAPYVLGIVGEDYVPVQNRQAFAFMDGLAQANQVRYDVAGSLYNGRRVWALARTGEFCLPGTDDLNLQYLLLVNDHTGAMSFRCFFTSVRVVCANTMNAALSVAKKDGKVRDGIAIRHTGDMAARMEEAQSVFLRSHGVFENYEEFAGLLVRKQMTPVVLGSFLAELVPDPPAGKRASRSENIRDELTTLFDSGKGNDMVGVKGTAWAAFNAVTEFVDHVRTNKGGAQDNQDKRFISSFWGTGEKMKQEAASLLVKIAA